MLAQRRIILTKSRFSRHIATVAISLLFVNLAAAQAQLSADTIAKIDKIAADTLASTGVPSASVHGGEVSGFTAQNNLFPDDRAAVIVLTNQDAASASGIIAGGISQLLFATTGVRSGFAKLARRHDPAGVHCQISAKNVACLDVRNARWET